MVLVSSNIENEVQNIRLLSLSCEALAKQDFIGFEEETFRDLALDQDQGGFGETFLPNF